MKQTRLPPVRTAMWRNVWLGLGLCACLGAANAATIDALVTTDGGQPLGDAVIVAAPHAVSLEAVTADATLDQIDKQFMPGLLVVQVGTRVHFPNHDHVRHQVYSFSPAKPFELPLYAGSEAPPIVFDRPGPVALGCNIHDWMRGYVYVAESPWFGHTDKSGVVHLNLPPGEYDLHVWHAQMRDLEDSTRVALKVPDAGSVAHQWQLALKPSFVPRRAPMSDSGGY